MADGSSVLRWRWTPFFAVAGGAILFVIVAEITVAAAMSADDAKAAVETETVGDDWPGARKAGVVTATERRPAPRKPRESTRKIAPKAPRPAARGATPLPSPPSPAAPSRQLTTPLLTTPIPPPKPPPDEDEANDEEEEEEETEADAGAEEEHEPRTTVPRTRAAIVSSPGVLRQLANRAKRRIEAARADDDDAEEDEGAAGSGGE